jgi:hypothetical protein
MYPSIALNILSAVFALFTAPPDGLAFDEMFFTRNFGFADFDNFLVLIFMVS